jgi:polyphosphate kinase
MHENHPNLFLSRDSSWLKFNRRVLEESQNPDNPLLERVKFLAITASNLDEFIEVRIAGMLQRIEEGLGESGPDGTTPTALLEQISGEMQTFVAEQYACWNNQLHPALSAEGIRVLQWSELDEGARKAASRFYQREVDPLLTPITIDPRHPFPRVLNKALSIAPGSAEQSWVSSLCLGRSLALSRSPTQKEATPARRRTFFFCMT